MLQTNGLEQVEELKRDLVEVRGDEKFELIYTLRQFQKAQEMKVKVLERQAKTDLTASSIPNQFASELMDSPLPKGSTISTKRDPHRSLASGRISR